MFKVIQEVLANTLSIDQSKITENTSMENLFEWDSLHHLNVIMDLESRLNIKFKNSEIMKMNSVKNIQEIIKEKGLSKAS